MTPRPHIPALVALASAVMSAMAAEPPKPASRPADNLDYWLQQAQGPSSQPGQDAAAAGSGQAVAGTDAAAKDTAARQAESQPAGDALPAVVELSDGRVLAGGMRTTGGGPFVVYEESAGRYRLVPPAAVLSVTAILVEERMELVWRWKAMGVPERVYTGEKYPFRLFRWRFRLADGTSIEGTVRGQPFWVQDAAAPPGPLILHERYSGKPGEPLGQAAYVKRLIVSRRLAEAVAAGRAARSRPAAGGGLPG